MSGLGNGRIGCLVSGWSFVLAMAGGGKGGEGGLGGVCSEGVRFVGESGLRDW